MKILVLKESFKIPSDDVLKSDLVLIINRNGTFDVIKNRHGFQDLTGNYGQLLDTGATNRDLQQMILPKQQEKNNDVK